MVESRKDTNKQTNKAKTVAFKTEKENLIRVKKEQTQKQPYLILFFR